MSLHALILAGGVGTRLWPLSRQALPKQLLTLFADHSMLQTTAQRILPLVSDENIYVATNEAYTALVREQLPRLNPKNVIGEPVAKGTAPCIGLAALYMRQVDPEAVMVSLHADHFIRDEEGFRQAVLAGAELAKQGYLVSLGIQPEYAETGYGYIHRAEGLGSYYGYEGYRVARFMEKPNAADAEMFVKSGEYYWNSGIFMWKVETLLEAFKKSMPDTYALLQEVEHAAGDRKRFTEAWNKIIPQSIDVGIMEKAERVGVVPAAIGWSDVGSWSVIHQLGNQDSNGNVVEDAEHIGIDTTNSLIKGEGRLVATIGLDNVIIIDTHDALLICSKDRSQEVKFIVDALKAKGKSELL